MVQGPPKSKSIEKDVVCGADVCLLSTTQRSGWPKKKNQNSTHTKYTISGFIFVPIQTHVGFLTAS